MNQETTSGAIGTPGHDVEVGDASRLPSDPLVSVCMITYNHASYIRQALDSVLMQQVDFPYEICLGEDHSNDGTRDICVEYAQRHPDKIRLFLRDRTNPARQQYKVPYAHNAQATYAACRGKYIAFIEGDDYWISQTKLSRQVAVLESNPAITVAAHYTIRIPEEKPWKAYLVPDLPMRDLVIENLLRARFYIHTSSLLLRRYEEADSEIFRGAPCGDVPRLFCQLLRGTGLMLPQVMSVYRVHEGGAFSARSAPSQIGQTVELWEMLERFVPPPLRPMHQIGYVKILADATAEYRRGGLGKEAAGSFRKAISVVGAMGTCSLSDRMSGTADVLESLLFPRLRRIRQRLMGKVRSKRCQRVFDAASSQRHDDEDSA
jgi:hypothetical protein